jgi:hypothetical protein
MKECAVEKDSAVERVEGNKAQRQQINQEQEEEEEAETALLTRT